MKNLWLVLTLFGQFQVEEIQVASNDSATVFLQEELQGNSLPEEKVKEKPEFELLSAPWCGACQSVKQTLGRFEKETLPFTYSVSNVDSRGWLGASSIPAWAYKGKVFQYGFSTPENLMKNFKRVTAPKSTKAANQRLTSAELKEFARTYRGPLRGVRGNNFWSHLQDLPNHGFLAWQLNGLSQRECEMIHGGQHYGYITPFNINK